MYYPQEYKIVVERLKELRVQKALDEVFNYYKEFYGAKGDNKLFFYNILVITNDDVEEIMNKSNHLYKIFIEADDDNNKRIKIVFKRNDDKIDFLKEHLLIWGENNG